MLEEFFAKQEHVLASRLGANDPQWFDEERWAKELTNVLAGMGMMISEQTGRQALQGLSGDPAAYDLGRTTAYVMTVSEASARRINEKTREAVLDGREVDRGRAGRLSVGLTTQWSSWGILEAGRQAGAEKKTWITGENSRPEHEAMNGETVPLDEPFSNGLMYPGAGTYGCNCTLGVQP